MIKKFATQLKNNLPAVIASFSVGIILVFLVLTFVLASPSLLYASVTFDTDHGTQIESMKIKIGTAPEIPQIVRKYNTFDGWYLDKERTLPYRGEKIYKNTTLYAKWDTVFTKEYLMGYAGSLQQYYNRFMVTDCLYDINPDSFFSDSAISSCYPGMKIFAFVGGTYNGINTELAIGFIFPTLEMADAFYEEIYPKYCYQFDIGNIALVRKDVLFLIIVEGNQSTFLGSLYETEDFVYAVNEEGTEASIVRYLKDEQSVVVPAQYFGLPVTSIGALAFAEKNFSEISLSASIKTIGKFAFLNCKNMSELSLPNSINMLGNGFIVRSGIASADTIHLNGSAVYQIMDGALYDNTYKRLMRNFGDDKDFAVRQGTLYIDAFAFEGSVNLENIAFPEGLLIIDTMVFFGCYSLQEAFFPQSIKMIGYRSFSCSAEDQPSALKTVRFASGCHMMELSDNAFEKNTLLESFFFPDRVDTPGNYIFEDCSGLKEVTLSKNLTEIPYGLFKGCSSLQTVTTAEPVKIINSEAFRDCSSLVAFDFSGAVYIGSNAFENCVSLLSIELSDSLEVCDNSAFAGCAAVEKLVLPSTLQQLGYWAASGMSGLKEITLPIMQNYSKMFFYMGNLMTQNLKKITINNAVSKIPDYYFEGMEYVAEIVLPDGVQTIGTGAFSQCTRLSNLVLPQTVKFLGNSAFYKCSSLASIVLPQGLTEIDFWCFAECSSLSSIDFPSSLKRLGGGAFRDCVLLENVFLPDYMDYVANGVFAGCFAIKEFRVPLSDNENIYPKSIQAYTQNYSGNYASNVEKVTISPGTSVIAWQAFAAMDKLNEIIFPSTVTRFENGALSQIPNIKKLDITCTSNYGRGLLEGSGSLEELTLNLSDDPSNDMPGYFGYFFIGSGGRDSGYQNYHVKKITVASSNRLLGSYSFAGAKGLTELVLPDTLTAISEGMLSGCVSLKNIEIPAGVTSIERFAFRGCSSLEEIAIPAKVSTIGVSAFGYCASLRKVNIAEGSELYSLGENVFEYCTSLEDIHFRDYTVWRIPASAFYGCSSLKNIVLPEGLQEIGSGAFTSSGIVSISIPTRVTSIGWYAFSNCADLKTFEFRNIQNAMISDIGAYAFMNCASLERIVFPVSLLAIGVMAFYNCSSLKEVYVLREYDYRKSWQTAATRLEISSEHPTFEGCHPDITFYVPTRNGNVEYDGQYGPGSKGGVTAYKEYALGWQVYADRIQAIPPDFQV